MALYDNTKDIIISEDLEVLNGDFKIGDASNNYIEYYASSHSGHYKEFPTIGIGILNYLNSNEKKAIIERDIINQLNEDIFTNPDVDLSDFPSKIIINKVVIEKV